MSVGEGSYTEGGNSQKTRREREDMNSTLFKGLGVALPTPFSGNEVDFSALERLIDRQLAAGADALIICGTTGEPSTLTSAERDRILVCALDRAAGRVPVIAGTGSNDTAEAIRRSLRARSLGASALLVVTPYYNRTTQSGLIAHFTAVADEARLPVILYNVPSRTGVNLLPDTAAVLATHPYICGVKEASGDVFQLAGLQRLAGERLAIYAGNDDQTLPALALGGQGVISVAANVVPESMRRLVSSWFSGDVAGARDAQLELLPLIRQLFVEPNPIPLKAALEMLGLCSSQARLPLVGLSEAHRASLLGVLMELGLLPETP